jgi:cardiolipin synthase
VVDGRLLFCGGINLLDDFMDPHDGPQAVARLDYAVCLSGPVVAQAQRLMSSFWTRLHARYQLEEGHFRAAGATLLAAAGGMLPRHIDVSPWGESHVMDDVHASLVLRDNVRNRSRIEKSYRQAISQARWEIVIANAYFLPGRSLRLALVHAASRGVRVKLVLQARYEYFFQYLQYRAARVVYAELLAAGVEICEYHAGFLHAKVAVVDGLWSTVGSSNLDPLSLLLAREANVVVEDARFANALRERLLASVAGRAQPLDRQRFSRRPLRQHILDTLAYAFVRISLFVIGRRY